MDRVLQFGTGRFLRGFVESFIDEAERARSAAGQPPGSRVTVVETTGSGMAQRLAAQDHAYELYTRGLAQGVTVDTSRTVRVIDASIDASSRFDEVVDAALDPDVKTIVSNTTERGYEPGRYPRLLAKVLAARARARLPGLVVLPCELIERNGDRLRQLVVEELSRADDPPDVIDRVHDTNAWATTMVDRIVTTAPSGSAEASGLDVVAEPYASWVIEVADDAGVPQHPCVTRTTDATPYTLRKTRILNGAHTALVSEARDGGFSFVREALDDAAISEWLEGLLREEIVPALADRIVDGQDFVTSVLERLRNPFLDHRLSDIESNHAQKLRLRLLPTYEDYLRLMGRTPRRLARILEREGVLA
jgi:tagaturonate reductase